MYITIAIYRQASMNIRINVGQQQNWWWWWWWGGGGVHKGKNFLLHFSLNHGILSRMALFLEKLDFFYFQTPYPSPPLLENSNFFFFWTLPKAFFNQNFFIRIRGVTHWKITNNLSLTEAQMLCMCFNIALLGNLRRVIVKTQNTYYRFEEPIY